MAEKAFKWRKCGRDLLIDTRSLGLSTLALHLRLVLEVLGHADDDQLVGGLPVPGVGWALDEYGDAYEIERLSCLAHAKEPVVAAALSELQRARIAVRSDADAWGTRDHEKRQQAPLFGGAKNYEYKLRRRARAGVGASMWVYFIQAGNAGPVKIGVSNSPTTRMAELQTGIPYTLRLLGQRPGTVVDERALHEQLAEHRIRGEWFSPHFEVLEAVQHG